MIDILIKVASKINGNKFVKYIPEVIIIFTTLVFINNQTLFSSFFSIEKNLDNGTILSIINILLIFYLFSLITYIITSIISKTFTKKSIKFEDTLKPVFNNSSDINIQKIISRKIKDLITIRNSYRIYISIENHPHNQFLVCNMQISTEHTCLNKSLSYSIEENFPLFKGEKIFGTHGYITKILYSYNNRKGQRIQKEEINGNYISTETIKQNHFKFTKQEVLREENLKIIYQHEYYIKREIKKNEDKYKNSIDFNRDTSKLIIKVTNNTDSPLSIKINQNSELIEERRLQSPTTDLDFVVTSNIFFFERATPVLRGDQIDVLNSKDELLFNIISQTTPFSNHNL